MSADADKIKIRGLILDGFLKISDIKFLSVRARDSYENPIDQKIDEYLDFEITNLFGLKILQKLEEFPDYLDRNIVVFSKERRIKEFNQDAFWSNSNLSLHYTIDEYDSEFAISIIPNNYDLVSARFDNWLQTEQFKIQILPYLNPSLTQELYQNLSKK